jgi:large subunit ribosomal protein L15
MGLHNFTTGTKQSAKRVGRGGKRGKTAGRGMKGQKARAGGTPRPAYRDVIKKIPKLRGHGVNRARTVNPNKKQIQTITLSIIDQAFAAGEVVNRNSLAECGVMDRTSHDVKIVATGDINQKLEFDGLSITDAAKQKIEAAGGTIK